MVAEAADPVTALERRHGGLIAGLFGIFCSFFQLGALAGTGPPWRRSPLPCGSHRSGLMTGATGGLVMGPERPLPGRGAGVFQCFVF